MRSKAACAALTTALIFFLIAGSRAADSADIYQTKCAMCHAADASGNSVMAKKIGAPSLKSDTVRQMKDTELAGVITKGKNKMPAFSGKLTEEEVAGLVKYIRALK